MSVKVEREIKLAFATPDDARVAVLTAGATLVATRRLQHDVLLDTPDHSLFHARSALRVRRDGQQTFLTFKGPQQQSTVKAREEIETDAGDADVLLSIFDRLGFRAAFHYEKYREEYRRDEAVIAIDETPIGTFVEIEGDEGTIEVVVRAMGRGPAQYILESYRTLYVREREAKGLPVTDMLFTRV